MQKEAFTFDHAAVVAVIDERVDAKDDSVAPFLLGSEETEITEAPEGVLAFFRFLSSATVSTFAKA